MYVDESYVLSRIDESTIFSNYFGEFELGAVYHSPFRQDTNPSTGFYISKNGGLIFNDIKTGEKLNCFRYVKKLYGLKYDNEAIMKVAENFGLIKGVEAKFDKARVFHVQQEINKETLIQFEPAKWHKIYLDYLRQGDIDESDIPKGQFYPIKRLWLNKKEIETKEIRFAQLVFHNDKLYTKVYSPHSTTMKWLSNIPLSVPFGMNTLKYQSDTVFIAKSFKDMMLLRKIFPDVIATQNESESALTDDTQEHLINKFNRRIIIWDNDKTGVENCTKFNERGFGYFNIPNEYYLNFGIKDPFDYVSYYGIDSLKNLFKEKNLL